MAGRIKRMIDTIVEKRSQGNQFIRDTTRVKLILKGINPDRFDGNSEDDPVILEKLNKLAVELGVKI